VTTKFHNTNNTKHQKIRIGTITLTYTLPHYGNSHQAASNSATVPMEKEGTPRKIEGKAIIIAHTYELDMMMKKKGFLYDMIRVLLLERYQVSLIRHHVSTHSIILIL
jgi:hypothetical protein